MRPPRGCRVGAGILGAGALAAATLFSCAPPRQGGSRDLAWLLAASERPVWEPIARAFEAAHPGVSVELVEGPNATDARQDLSTASLLARDDSFDLVSMDVTWTAQFAAAGWLLPLEGSFPASATEALLPEDVEAGRYRGHLYRIPVRTDVGLLYARADLLESVGIASPQTFADLFSAARSIQSPPRLWGFVWPGSQYEGLVCLYLEVLHGFGGFWIEPATGKVGLDRREALAALRFLFDCRAGANPISPRGVTAYKEEESRRLFQDGRAVFLRNWPYVWRLAQRAGSSVAGRIRATTMVHAPGRTGAGTLGGWGFGVSRFSRHPELAIAFIRHAISLESQRALCAETGFAPARIDAYRDPALLAANPFLPTLLALHAGAIARPAIPRYALASDILQRQLSAALSGLRAPETALSAAAQETRRLLGDTGR